ERHAQLGETAVQARVAVVLVVGVVETDVRAAGDAEARARLHAPAAERVVADVAVAPDLKRARRQQRHADATRKAVALAGLVVVVAQAQDAGVAHRAEADTRHGEPGARDLVGRAAVVVVTAADLERRSERRAGGRQRDGGAQHGEAENGVAGHPARRTRW